MLTIFWTNSIHIPLFLLMLLKPWILSVLTFTGLVFPELPILVLIAVLIVNDQVLLSGFGDADGAGGQSNKEKHWTINLTITINTSHISVHLSSKEKLQQNYNIRQHYYHTLVKIYRQEWFHFHSASEIYINRKIFLHSKNILKIKVNNHFSFHIYLYL